MRNLRVSRHPVLELEIHLVRATLTFDFVAGLAALSLPDYQLSYRLATVLPAWSQTQSYHSLFYSSLWNLPD